MANIKDLKIGDIITATSKRNDERFVLIYNGINENYCNCIRSFCHVFNEDYFYPKPCDTLISVDNCFVDKSTVEEVQMLFKKIHDAGYRWDKEKLELVAKPNRVIDLTKDVQVMHGAADGLEWISVEERLPPEREHVWVLGIEEQLGINTKHTWISKRKKPDSHTDGYGFIKTDHGHLRITHWFPIPKLDGKELFETLPE